MGNIKKNSYLTFLLIHVGIGMVVFLFPFFSKIYSILIFGFGVYTLMKSRNQNNEALVLSAYVIGVEVFLRMTDGMHFNEFGKYTVMIFLFIGMFYSGFSKKSFIYWLFILFLIPGILLSTVTLSLEANIRKAIAFNISGPVCLAVSAIYCYRRTISLERLKDVLKAMTLPLVSILTYLYLFTPSVKDVVSGTQSNFETSGGFGPNQMATILGLAMFLFFALLILDSGTKKEKLIYLFLIIFSAYRGVVTFSRGGVITGIVMIFLLLTVIYLKSKSSGKLKIGMVVIVSLFLAMGIWLYSSAQTSGMIDKRYANEDARGRKKESRLTGREKLIELEFQMFMDNPIMGIGVGKNKEYREELTGIEAASHNEITRMLAEHGFLGIVNLLILLITPLVLYVENKQHLFLFSFMAFWILTINHAAMRLAAPAFVYALSLLKVYIIEEPAVHRE